MSGAPSNLSFVKVLGIDPARLLADTASSTKAKGASGQSPTAAGQLPLELRQDARLKTIFDGVGALIAEHAPDAVALEESYVGRRPHRAFWRTGARGSCSSPALAPESTRSSTHPRT